MPSRERHALYQLAAQNPDADLQFFDRIFQERLGRTPKTLREDFCGSAYLSCCFARSDASRSALGVDPDPEPLQWCRHHNFESEQDPIASRVRLVQSEILEGPAETADIVCAMNFGLFLLRNRRDLRRYFELSKERAAGGLFIAEIVGGEESIKPLLESREEDGFTYVWEQEWFNPIDSTMRAHVHFELPGEQLYRAFTYDWRVWTLVELREVLEEAGFSQSLVYWENVGEDGYGTGEYHLTEREEQQESWLCYLVGVP